MSKKQDRQGVRTAQDLERKYKLGQYKKLIKELNAEVNTLKNNASTSEVITKTISIFLEPGQEELQTTGNHVNGSVLIPDDKIPLYDFNNDGVVDMEDHLMCGFAGAGFATLAGWSGAKTSEVTVTIDMSSPEKIVSAKGINMWGREVELTSSELIAAMLLDINLVKTTASSKITKTISLFLEPGQEEANAISAIVGSGEEATTDANNVALYDFNGDGEVSMIDTLMADRASNGLISLANWSRAVKSDVTITIDMSAPEKIVSAKGTNMWGREVELSSTEVFEYLLKDIEYNKTKIEVLRDSINELSDKVDAFSENTDTLEENNDSGWVKCPLREDIVTGTLQIRKIGKVVHLKGNLTLISNVSTTDYFATIDEEYLPATGEYIPCFDSGYNKFILSIVKLKILLVEVPVVYFNQIEGTLSSGAWLPINATWFVD